jgi:thiol-disulfide isomerase/thioredoxin
MLVFTSAGCGACQALLPDVVRWQDQHADRLALAIVAAGPEDANRDKAAHHGLTSVLLDRDRVVAEAFAANVTPSAVIVSPLGLIESPLVGGVPAITTLVEQATRAARPVPVAPPAGRPPSPPPPDPRVGQPAPDVVLTGLDGDSTSLADAIGERGLVLFWNPGCGFCQRMLPDLHAFEADPPPGAPPLVVVSAGEPERVRAQGIASPVLLDTDGAAARAFGAGGTPMGVLVADGRVASGVAAGAAAVLELARAASVGQTAAALHRDTGP